MHRSVRKPGAVESTVDPGLAPVVSPAPAWDSWLHDAEIDGAERAFVAVLSGAASARSGLSEQLKVRSTTVSAWVAAMVQAGLLTEQFRKPDGRGRPLGHLVANPDRLAVSVVMVHSQSLHVSVVNLNGHELWHDRVPVAAEASNAVMRRALRALQERAILQLGPDTTLVGVSFSLTGLVNIATSQWVFSSRWPRISQLDLNDCSVPKGARIHVVRNVDAQLLARTMRREQVGSARRTLLLHWGYGIGMTFGPASVAATTTGQRAYGYGEVGHWQLGGQRMLCRCGHVGCLETVAALWAIGPALLGERFDGAMDETQVAQMLQGMALTRKRVFKRALHEITEVLVNLCRLYFPSEVVVSGPFIENAQVWTDLSGAWAKRDLLVGLPMPPLVRQRVGHQLEMEGASMPLLLHGLQQLVDLSLQQGSAT
jgi:predicted NBD/HSP70 family sugar kinase